MWYLTQATCLYLISQKPIRIAGINNRHCVTQALLMLIILMISLRSGTSHFKIGSVLDIVKLHLMLSLVDWDSFYVRKAGGGLHKRLAELTVHWLSSCLAHPYATPSEILPQTLQRALRYLFFFAYACGEQCHREDRNHSQALSDQVITIMSHPCWGN